MELSYIPHTPVFREHERRTVARPINTKEPQRQKPTINTRGPQKHKKHTKSHKKTQKNTKNTDNTKSTRNTKTTKKSQKKPKKITKKSTTIQRVQNKKYFTGKTLRL